MSEFDDAMAAGVVRNRAEFDALARAPVHATGLALGASVADLTQALARVDLMTLDNLGIRVRAPEVPRPEPEPAVLAYVARMYGARLWDYTEVNDRRWAAARRTAVAMERRRQGWTHDGAMAEWQARVVQQLTEQAEP